MAKQVVDRDRSSRIVVAAIEQHGAAIGAALGDALAPYAREERTEVPDLAKFLHLLGRLLSSRAIKLVKASDAHEQEATDDAEPRERRDDNDRELRQELSGLRTTVQGVFGDAGLRALAMWDPLPPGPDPLSRYAHNVQTALSKPGLALTPHRHPGAFEFRSAVYASSLQTRLEALDKALADVSRERAEADTTLVAKTEAMAAHDRDFVRFAGLVEQAARAAGKTDLADRIRPSNGDPGVLLDPGDPTKDPIAVVGRASPTDPATPRIEPGMPGSSPFRE